MIRLPSTGFWRSTQNGDAFGEIVASKNIDLARDGVVRLARKGMGLFSYGPSSDGLAAVDPGMQDNFLGGVTGVGNGSTETNTSYAYWLSSTAGGCYVTRLDIFGTSTEQAPSSNSPSIGVDSDIVMFKGKPHVSGGAYLSDLNLGFSTWQARRVTDLTVGVPHPLCVVEQLNSLAVGNGNAVRLYDSSYFLTQTLVLPSEYYAVSMRWRQNNLYIGTRHVNGGEAKMFVWDGSGSIAQYGFGCGADWIYSLCEFQSRMTIVTSAGQVRSFNGGGFDEVANFPVYYSPFSWNTTKTLNYIYGRVANRGMVAVGSSLYVNIDGSINNAAGVAPGSYLPSQPSGLWEFTAKSGLWHKAGVNFGSRLRLAPTALNSSNLSFSTAHQAAIGDPVVIATSSLTGVTDGQVYYAVPGSATTLALALTPQDALAGRTVTMGGTVASTVCILDRYETLGVNVVTNPGGIIPLGGTSLSPFYGTEVLYGAGLGDAGLGLSRVAVCSLGMGQNRGSLTTAKLRPADANEFFKKFYAFASALTLDTDQIILKYRTSERAGMPSPLAFSGTPASWTSATTFTVDSALKDVQNIQIGDELEIISGAAAGYTAHVTLIDSSSPTYAFTIDERMPVSSGTFDFVADNWTKYKPAFTRASFAELRSGVQASLDRVQGKWLQLKLELRGRDIALQEVEISNSAKQ
jgi:hypothetical protein